jgi:hypothetical protein
MKSPFAHVTDRKWKLNDQLPRHRRDKLLNSEPYEQLVENLLRGMAISNVKREESRDVGGYFRAVVTLQVHPKFLDLFYSSASGYRAQYYHSPKLGSRANRFALDRLLPRVIRAVAAINKRTCPGAWVESSLRDPSAKLWPHQGVWVRYGRRADQNLLVSRWVARQSDTDEKRRKRAIRSMLTPAEESLLELKGGFLSRTGKPLGTLKPQRSNDIHNLGYT